MNDRVNRGVEIASDYAALGLARLKTPQIPSEKPPIASSTRVDQLRTTVFMTNSPRGMRDLMILSCRRHKIICSRFRLAMTSFSSSERDRISFIRKGKFAEVTYVISDTLAFSFRRVRCIRISLYIMKIAYLAYMQVALWDELSLKRIFIFAFPFSRSFRFYQYDNLNLMEEILCSSKAVVNFLFYEIELQASSVYSV